MASSDFPEASTRAAPALVVRTAAALSTCVAQLRSEAEALRAIALGSPSRRVLLDLDVTSQQEQPAPVAQAWVKSVDG